MVGRVNKFVKKHPLYTVAAGSIIFITFVVVASLYANELVWNFSTGPGGVAQGRGGSLTQTLVQYDGTWYTHIAQYGYTRAMSTNFLPLYPLLIRGVSDIFSLPIDYAALITSWVALSAGAVVLYKWIKVELDYRGYKVSPWIPIGLIAIFPTAVYLALPYTESLFLLLNVIALLLFRKKHYICAGLVAALASATHEQGILLCLFFLADYWFAEDKKELKKLIPVALGALGIVAYMAYLWVHFGNPVEFLVAAKDWGRLSPNVIANLVQTMRPQYIWFIGVGLTGLWCVWKYLGKAYFIYSLVFFLMPLVSGNLTSINRYLLSLLPMFLGLGIFVQKKVPAPIYLLYTAISAFLLGWSLLLFANGYWVA